MGERKVLNKYYPPDFDPAKIPKLQLPKDRQYVVRLMAPFSMRCTTCGEYIYKGKKFNARKETVWDQGYLGIRIYRFYIRCTRCISEITFKTDPQNTDYVCENGAVRNFQAERLALLAAEEEEKLKETEEAENPMLALERRTKESKQEIDILDALEGIKDQNSRLEQVNVQKMLEKYGDGECKSRITIAEIEDEVLVRKYFGGVNNHKLVEDISEVETNGIDSQIERKRRTEDELIPEGKRCLIDELESHKPNSNDLQKKSYKSKLQSFVSVKPTQKQNTISPDVNKVVVPTKPENSNAKGLLKLGDYSSGHSDSDSN